MNLSFGDERPGSKRNTAKDRGQKNTVYGVVAHQTRRRFGPCHLRVEGRSLTYVLADQEVHLLKGKLRLRQVTPRMDNGHQTPILTIASGFIRGPRGLPHV